MGLILPSGCMKADIGSQVASDNIAIPQGWEFPALFILLAGNTCNHVVTIDCHLIGSHLSEFCLPPLGWQRSLGQYAQPHCR